jgi:hypothetical protein
MHIPAPNPNLLASESIPTPGMCIFVKKTGLGFKSVL